MEASTQVGTIIKSFGKDGYMKLVIDGPFLEDVSRSYYLLIEKDGFQLPYFIEDLDLDNGLVKFDEIRGPEDTKEISDKKLFLLSRHVQSIPSKEPLNNHIIGYTVMDQKDQLIGTIKEILSMPMQEIIVVQSGADEFMIPFHEDLLIAFDEAEKFIKLEIAEGLLDI